MKLDNTATRAAAAILIAAVFLLILVVASVQQQAAAQLEAHDIKQSYSVARNNLQKASRTQEDLKRANERLLSFRTRESGLAAEKDKLELELVLRTQDVAAVARTIGRSKLCPMLSDVPPANASAEPGLWDRVQDCAQDGQLPPGAVAMFDDLRKPPNNPTQIRSGIERNARETARTGEDIKTAEADIARQQESLKQAQQVTEALQDVVVLDDNGVISWITRLPPVLMQIVLCFVAGLFGALLLTLILGVYPDNDFHFAMSKSYWKRIFLGGVISVAVYVVIGSGVAVLGSSRALIEDANVMSYTAIGILAGMFSERVARFLSRKGDVFAGDETGKGKTPSGKDQGAKDQAAKDEAAKDEAAKDQQSRGTGGPGPAPVTQ